MTLETLLNAMLSLFTSLSGKVFLRVGDVSITGFSFIMIIWVVPVVLMTVIPWYDDDGSDD